MTRSQGPGEVGNERSGAPAPSGPFPKDEGGKDRPLRPLSTQRRTSRVASIPPEAAARLAALQERLGLSFSDLSVLLEAITHSSYAHEAGTSRYPSNERLEFLGDGVLNLVVGEWLWESLPDAPEGVLTRRRAALVSAGTLARWARSLELHRYVLLGTGEEATGGRRRSALLGDAFEAVVGAVFVAFGWDRARAFVRGYVEDEVRQRAAAAESDGESVWIDAKSRLQERLQAERKSLPAYRLLREEGPPHRRWFTVAVEWDGEVRGTGRGPTRKQAEQEAARAALATMAPLDPAEPESPRREEGRSRRGSVKKRRRKHGRRAESHRVRRTP